MDKISRLGTHAQMELHVIRHCQTVANQSDILQGWSDSPLVPEQVEAFQVISFNASIYDAIFSSDSGRCMETCSALRLSGVTTDARLRERNFGVFENTSHSVLSEKFQNEYTQFQELSADYQPSEGESRKQHFDRLSSWFQSILHYDRVLAVSHGGTLDFLYRLARGIDLHGGEQIFDGENAAISEFRLNWPEVQVIRFNVALDV